MATLGKSDSQIWDEMSRRWDAAHTLAVTSQSQLVNEMNANFRGTGAAPSRDAMDKVAALWAEANRLRDEGDAFIRAQFG